MDSEESIERQNTYMELLDKIEDIEERNDLGIQTVAELGSIVKNLNRMIQGPSDDINAEEIFLDSTVLESSSKILVDCISSVNISSNVYEPAEFGQKLCDYLRNEDEEFKPSDFLKLLPDAREIIPQVPRYECMYGCFDLDKIPEVQEKVKKPIVRSQRENFSKKEPEKVVSVEEDDEGIEEIVKLLLKVLVSEYKKNNGDPVDYWRFVVDSNDFSKTVENVFHCSFLIRDGRAKLNTVSNTPTLEPVSRHELEQKTREIQNHQTTMTVTFDEWMKHRDQAGLIEMHRTKK